MTTRNAFCLLMLCAVLLVGCKGRGESAGNAATETIAPAAPQPADTGTDAMTQTVDIEDSRSISEGGTLSDTADGTTPTATDATAAATPTTVPPPIAPAPR